MYKRSFLAYVALLVTLILIICGTIGVVTVAIMGIFNSEDVTCTMNCNAPRKSVEGGAIVTYVDYMIEYNRTISGLLISFTNYGSLIGNVKCPKHTTCYYVIKDDKVYLDRPIYDAYGIAFIPLLVIIIFTIYLASEIHSCVQHKEHISY